jgi:hypothetical protein
MDDTGGPKAHYITRMSYLYEFQETAVLRSQLQECFREGRVQVVANGTGPFPAIIQCGAMVPEGTDRELGARILFLNSYSKGSHMVERDAFYPDLSGVSWISRERFDGGKSQPKPLYMDSHWVCLAGDATGGFYYSARYPLVYARNR